MPIKSCININFDSINSWAFSRTKGTEDPAFVCAERFFELSRKFNFKYTIFVNGNDIECPKAAERVKQWASEGHEIANHSYSHKLNLGSLEDEEIEAEVMRSHEMIARITGKEPRGFVAPAWSFSEKLIKVLSRNGYLYDTSVFPSYFMWAASLKLWWNLRNDEQRKTIFKREDRMMNLLGGRKPFMLEGLLEIPLPVTPVLRIPCWHTMSMLFPKAVFGSVLDSCLGLDYFYYLLHPADLIGWSDIPEDFTNSRAIERINIPMARKAALIDNSLEKIVGRSGKIVTLEEIAREILDEGSYIRK
jgi:hypothetical protein